MSQSINGPGARAAGAGHIISAYEQELRALRDLLTEMGGRVENGLALAMRAVLSRDEAAALGAIDQDRGVDELERRIEGFVIRLLALRQPLADDLREIVASLRITAALERIGDYARNIAKRSMVVSDSALPYRNAALAQMGRLAQENLRLVIDAVGERDAARAEQVWRSDEGIDDLYTAIFRELITYMMEDPRNITPCTHLMFVAKNLERIGDHATNIAETVYYAATGTNLPDARPRGGAPFVSDPVPGLDPAGSDLA